MQPRRLFETLLFVLCVAFRQGRAQFEYESDIASWPQLKRQAGYRTESGKYRGGQYKIARSEGRALSVCFKHNERFCTEWLARKESNGLSEIGQCVCREESGPYCQKWLCSEKEMESANFKFIKTNGVYHGEISSCLCHKEAPNENYCEEWSCTETRVGGVWEDAHYRCLEADASKKFCFRWKGDIRSNRDVESTVCQCTDIGPLFCETWECVERGLVRCSMRRGGWCNFWAGVFAAGGIGFFFILVGSVTCAYRLINQIWDKKTQHMWDYLVYPYVLGLFLGLPWLAGVVIWGGVDAVQYVLPVWVCTMLIPCFSLCFYMRYRVLSKVGNLLRRK